MDATASPPKRSRTLLLAGAGLGCAALACGFGALALGGGWWYAHRPVGLHFSDASLTAEDALPHALPSVLLTSRVGDPRGTSEPVTWTVEPQSLGAAAGGNFLPAAPGTGLIRACAEGVCGTLPLTVQLADTLTLAPERAEFRVWTPRALKATASWKGTVGAPPLTWTSSDLSVATVDGTGTITPIHTGKAEIRVSGGGATGTAEIHVYPPIPVGCTLSTYADAMGRQGIRSEDRLCAPGNADACSWTGTQPLVDGGRIDDGGSPTDHWMTLWLPAADLDQVWLVAQSCLQIPPEVAALPVPQLLVDPLGGKRTVSLAAPEGAAPAEATVEYVPGKVTVTLPATAPCTATRTITYEKHWSSLGIAEGC